MKNNLSGWKNVYSFTLNQVLKGKAYRISFFIMALLFLASLPVASMLLFNNTGNGDDTSPIKKVYVNNMTSLEISFEDVKSMSPFKHIMFETVKGDYNFLVNHVSEKERTSVILDISEENGAYILHLSMAKDGPVKDIHIQSLGDALSKSFTNRRMASLGIGSEQLSMIQTPVEYKTTMTDNAGAEVIEESTAISFSEYWFAYGVLFFVMMGTVLTGSQVATSIVTEKSNRVVEYLLTSVKPLALMLGKVLAMMTSTLIQMLSLVAALFASNMISSLYTTDGGTLLSQLLPDDMFANINIINFIICVILVFMGLLFYAVLAAVAGATVSKLEELNEGLTLFTLSTLVGAYVGIGAIRTLMGSGMNAYVIFSLLFPLSSPFILPGAIQVGRASPLIICIAVVLLAAFIVLLFRFAARIYEVLFLHTGNTIKLKQLFKISKDSV